MTVMTPERIDRNTGTGGTLVHYEDPSNPGFTFCGIKVRKRVGGTADCVVCQSIEESRRETPREVWWKKWVSRRDSRNS